jgi:hypothetical protein
VVTCNACDKFLLAKSTKNVLGGVNFTNLKTPGGYIAKSKLQGICLQLTQTLGGDYVIWPLIKDQDLVFKVQTLMKLVSVLNGLKINLGLNETITVLR